MRPRGVGEALTDPASRIVSHLCIGIDAQPPRDTATVCVAGRRADSKPHVEWYETCEGVTWRPEWVLDEDVGDHLVARSRCGENVEQ